MLTVVEFNVTVYYCSYLQLDVVHITVQNTFQWLCGSKRDMNAVHVEVLTVRVSSTYWHMLYHCMIELLTEEAMAQCELILVTTHFVWNVSFSRCLLFSLCILLTEIYQFTTYEFLLQHVISHYSWLLETMLHGLIQFLPVSYVQWIVRVRDVSETLLKLCTFKSWWCLKKMLLMFDKTKFSALPHGGYKKSPISSNFRWSWSAFLNNSNIFCGSIRCYQRNCSLVPQGI